MIQSRFPGLASRRTCTGCMTCIDACGFGALTSEIRRDGHLYPQVEYSRCTGCGACRKVCPVLQKQNERTDGHSHPYAAWSNDRTLRMQSASGGIFAALATQILSEGGCVAGAVMDGLTVNYRFIERLDELPQLQGSKDQQGDLSGIYRETRKRLQAGRKVLFSGMGCQIAGLLSFLKSRKYSGELYTVDLICGGFPSVLPLQAFVAHADKPVLTIKTFRDKTFGWKSIGYAYSLKTINTDGSESDYGSKNLIIGAFNSHLTCRSSCLNCKFVGVERPSDLTIGDFWGDKEYPEEHFKGLSVVVSHSATGEKLLFRSKITIHPVRWDKFVFHNPRMVVGKFHYLRFHPARFLLRIFPYLPYRLQCNLYHGTPPVGLWKAYRALGVLMVKWSHAFNMKICRMLVNQLDK